MVGNVLSDLASGLQECSSDYEAVLDRIQEGGELDEADLHVSRYRIRFLLS